MITYKPVSRSFGDFVLVLKDGREAGRIYTRWTEREINDNGDPACWFVHYNYVTASGVMSENFKTLAACLRFVEGKTERSLNLTNLLVGDDEDG